jgi:hypothetical protein
MTRLTKPVRRETATCYQSREIIVTIAPCGGSQTESRIGVRLKGKRTQYVEPLSHLFIEMAHRHADKEKVAKKKARQNGVPWKQAKREFVRANSI